MALTFKEYSDKSFSRNKSYDVSFKLPICVLGLAGEAGEVSEKFKKMYRDANGVISDEFKRDVTKELGDVLWYINEISRELDINLEDVAKANIDKLEKRFKNKTLAGNGDNR